jgi:hypothetical protein
MLPWLLTKTNNVMTMKSADLLVQRPCQHVPFLLEVFSQIQLYVCKLTVRMRQIRIFTLTIYRFCRHTDENKRQKVALILDKLITMTIEEVEVR